LNYFLLLAGSHFCTSSQKIDKVSHSTEHNMIGPSDNTEQNRRAGIEGVVATYMNNLGNERSCQVSKKIECCD
jgi:hypothetical protein